VVIILFPVGVLAWGATGHIVVAELADMQLTLQARQQLEICWIANLWPRSLFWVDDQTAEARDSEFELR
jgi:hypothetical protein